MVLTRSYLLTMDGLEANAGYKHRLEVEGRSTMGTEQFSHTLYQNTFSQQVHSIHTA